jgi:hypothetical protein
MINEGRLAASGPPDQIVQDLFPDRPDADLNDAFVKLMSRGQP